MLKLTKVYSNKLPNDVDEVMAVVKEIIGFIKKKFGPLKECNLFELKVILNEILINALEHGNQGRVDKYIKICAFVLDGRFVSIVVEDEGLGYNYPARLERSFSDVEADDICEVMENGRGILIINSLCKKVRMNEKGNRIAVIKELERI